MNKRQGTIIALSTSEKKGIPKTNVPSVSLVKDWGIDGDAHAANWHRQVSFLAMESIEKMQALGAQVQPGDFAENITTAGIDIPALSVGEIIRIGDAILEVTQIGKECHTRCAIFHRVGDCVMPRDGVFARVLAGGVISVGDTMTASADDPT